MNTKENIKEILVDNNNLLFYKIMNYPIPIEKDFFLLEKKITITNELNRPEKTFSWTQKSQILKDYLNYINKFWWLYKSLPFVEHIYLCNSISFNAINKDSDIDIFIITKEKALRRARFFSRIFFSILFIKRSKQNKRKKFCLSFYTTRNNTNLYNISLPKSDIYLAYWLAHLVPLYQEIKYNIYNDNDRISSYLPNFPKTYSINIGIKIFKWKTKIKRILETAFWWYIWKIFENIIKSIRLPIVIYKKNNLKEKWRWIIINDNMLKFHQDIRKKIYIIFKSYKNKKNNTNI